MGKTYKDQANYYRFKDKLDDVPKFLKDKADVMSRHYKGYRFGDDRKSNATSKKLERKAKRCKEHPNKRHIDTDDYIAIPHTHGMK